MKVNYLKQDGDSIVFTGVYMEAYIPETTFETTDALELGDTIRLFGIFNFKVFDKIDITDKDRLAAPVQTFKMPSIMECMPTEKVVKIMSIDPTNPSIKKEPHIVLRFYNGDLIMKTVNIIKDVSNVEIFLKILNSAKIPRTIPYDLLPKLLQQCVDMNGVKSRVSPLIYEILVSGICRYAADPSKPFRYVIGAGKAGQNDYMPMRIRGIAQNASVFSGITFEDFNASAVKAINKKRYHEDQQISPVEKILKY